jgi:ABC-type branched-subunit amino acid transport system ATPase component/ABC-type branched-subunit amino acid transport system permease subunit
MRFVARAGAAALAAVLLVALLPSYHSFVAGRIAMLVIVTLGLNLLIGNAGLLSMASAAFMGVGGYLTAILVAQSGLPVFVAAPVAVAVAWVLGWILGTVSLRLSGFYLAVVTLGFLLVFGLVLRRGGTVTGGGYGLITTPPEVFGFVLTARVMSLLSAAVAGIAVVAVAHLTSSAVGRAWRTMKHSEALAQSFGMQLRRLKTSAFALSAALAGVAGALYAYLLQSVTPAAFGIFDSVDHLSYIIVGGVGTVWGSILGPIILELVPEVLRPLARQREVFTGVVLLVILVIAPTGVAGLIGRVLPRRRMPWGRLTDRFGARANRTAPHAEAATDAGAVLAATDDAPTVEDTDDRPPAAVPVTAPVSEGTPALEFHEVSVLFGGLRAVDEFSFEIRRGEFHGLIGPNGAGKSTAINALTQFVRIASGEIKVAGRTLVAPSGMLRPWELAAHDVARTFQNPVVVPALSVIDNVAVGLHPTMSARLPRHMLATRATTRAEARARERCAELLAALGFSGDLDAPAEGLSLGELRKVELARALVRSPRLLLLDEPTSGLEAHAAVDTLDLLRDVQREAHGDLTVLLVEHNVPLVFGHCDRVTVMERGRRLITDVGAIVREDERVKEAYLGFGFRGGETASVAGE